MRLVLFCCVQELAIVLQALARHYYSPVTCQLITSSSSSFSSDQDETANFLSSSSSFRGCTELSQKESLVREAEKERERCRYPTLLRHPLYTYQPQIFDHSTLHESFLFHLRSLLLLLRNDLQSKEDKNRRRRRDEEMAKIATSASSCTASFSFAEKKDEEKKKEMEDAALLVTTASVAKNEMKRNTPVPDAVSLSFHEGEEREERSLSYPGLDVSREGGIEDEGEREEEQSADSFFSSSSRSLFPQEERDSSSLSLDTLLRLVDVFLLRDAFLFVHLRRMAGERAAEEEQNSSFLRFLQEKKKKKKMKMMKEVRSISTSNMTEERGRREEEEEEEERMKGFSSFWGVYTADREYVLETFCLSLLRRSSSEWRDISVTSILHLLHAFIQSNHMRKSPFSAVSSQGNSPLSSSLSSSSVSSSVFPSSLNEKQREAAAAEGREGEAAGVDPTSLSAPSTGYAEMKKEKEEKKEEKEEGDAKDRRQKGGGSGSEREERQEAERGGVLPMKIQSSSSTKESSLLRFRLYGNLFLHDVSSCFLSSLSVYIHLSIDLCLLPER